MASSAKAAPSDAAPDANDAPALGRRSRRGWGIAADGAALLALGLAAAAIYAFAPGLLESAWLGLGWGWIPAGLLLAAVVLLLRYRPRLLAARWRPFVLAAAAGVLAVGALSTIEPAYGRLEDASLSGEWGLYVGGPSLPLTALKLAAIAAIVPLLLYPRSLGPYCWRGLVFAAVGLRAALRFLKRGLLRMTADVRQFAGLMRQRRQRRAAARAAAAGLDAAPPALAPGIIPAIPPTIPVETARPADMAAASAAVSPDAASPDMDDSGWRLPSVELLAPPDTHSAPEAELQQMSRLIEETLSDHGVRVEVTGIKAGPRIVQFGLAPGWVARRGGSNNNNGGGEEGPPAGERSRVKVQSILTREKDLALALRTPYLRIEAPVPGEALVGIELPTPSPSKVHLREVMQSPEFARLAQKGGLPIAMGQDTGGAAVSLDLAALPHILIAGATGAGKSVQINSIVASFLLTKTPEELRLLMVDPKRVELTPFNGIPHLVAPVLTDAERVPEALKGLIGEMNRRYKLMEETGARNIEIFNEKSPEKMPFLVLIVDELADLMMVAGFEVEQSLVRLAQLGRATGIHLVLATQRPSVNVVTGLLKANVPARCAFAVAGQVDSRVILDAVGAEKLMGKGDMLLLHKESPKPRRVQGTLVYDEEVAQLVDFWKTQDGPPVPEIQLLDGASEAEGAEANVDVKLLEQARELAARHPDLSPGFIERRLKVGNRKAEELLEILEEEGLVSIKN